MEKISFKSAFVLGFFVFIGLFSLGYFVSTGFLKSKDLERTVVAKGLSAQEVNANIVLWPIKFSTTTETLDKLAKKIESDTNKILEFLDKYGVKKEDITINSPSIIDKLASLYMDRNNPTLRYLATRTINVYSQDVEKIREVSGKMLELSQQGIVFSIDDWDTKIEYLYTKLNEIKPKMIEEATANAREVAQKFAQDSNSKLGKIKRASQGQFEITSRDKNSEHIKNVRVVSTIEYYLND